MSGNGTIALEVVRQLTQASGGVRPAVATVYATVGGGGMCAGVAAAIAAHAPGWQVVGCQPEASPVMHESVKADKVVHMQSEPTLSDGSAGGLEDGTVAAVPCQFLTFGFVRYMIPGF